MNYPYAGGRERDIAPEEMTSTGILRTELTPPRDVDVGQAADVPSGKGSSAAW